MIASIPPQQSTRGFLLLPASSCFFLLLPASSGVFLLLPASCFFLLLPASYLCLSTRGREDLGTSRDAHINVRSQDATSTSMCILKTVAMSLTVSTQVHFYVSREANDRIQPSPAKYPGLSCFFRVYACLPEDVKSKARQEMRTSTCVLKTQRAHQCAYSRRWRCR
jgi:hypothetical protein